LWSVKVMKLLIMEFFPASRHFLPLMSTYSPQHTLCSSFCMRVPRFMVQSATEISHVYITDSGSRNYFNIWCVSRW
jgi:hypothetical protein